MLDKTQAGWIASWYDNEWLPSMMSSGSPVRYSGYELFVISRL